MRDTIKEKLIEDFVNRLAQDKTKTSGIDFILVYITKDQSIQYSIGNELGVLIDEYDNEFLNEKEALNKFLNEQEAIMGAIYKRNKDKFELLITEYRKIDSIYHK